MKATFNRLRAPSLGGTPSRHLPTVPPPATSAEYSNSLAALAARVLYLSPLPSGADRPVYILDAAAFPDSKQVDYDTLLPYVLARLPTEDELIGGAGYEVVFFAGWTGTDNNRKRSGSAAGNGDSNTGDGKDGATAWGGKKSRPGWGWFLQAYHILSRAMRKRLMKLYVVHEKGWIRILMEMFATIVSPKMRKKVVHVSSLSGLALQIPIEDLLIPPTAYMIDRQKVPEIFAPYATGKRAFGVHNPLPTALDGSVRLPRVLREATNSILTDPLIKTEGIFRVSARAQTVEVVKEAFERAQKFVVWRDGKTVLTFPHFKDGRGVVAIEELDPLEGYDVHTAAALIKLWYHELREPILPQSSYQALEKFHAGAEPPDQQAIFDMLSPDSEIFSPFPVTSRKILITHLLPMLSRVAEHSDWNRMAPSNLATVFAPNFICGSDPIADLKISATVQRLLIAMITQWKALAPVLGCTDEAFEVALRLPESMQDWEDPLQEARQSDKTSATSPDQTSGVADSANDSAITMNDNDRASDGSLDEDDFLDDDGQRPPLPPRPTSASASTEDLNIRRKPAPAVVNLPRYSTVFGARPDLQQLGQTEPDHEFHQQQHPLATLRSNRDTIIENDTEPLPAYEQSTPSREFGHLNVSTSAGGISEGGDQTGESANDSPQSILRKPVPIEKDPAGGVGGEG